MQHPMVRTSPLSSIVIASTTRISTQYPTHYRGQMGWRYPYVLDEEKTKEQLSGLRHTLRTPLQRTLNPQVSGSNPEGRTNSQFRAFFRAKVSPKAGRTP
jgi:hypothetical protein